MKFEVAGEMPSIEDLEKRIQEQFPEFEVSPRFKFLVVKRSSFIGANVVLKKNKIVVVGTIPSIWAQLAFGGLLLYAFTYSGMKEVENQVGEFLQALYGG